MYTKQYNGPYHSLDYLAQRIYLIEVYLEINFKATGPCTLDSSVGAVWPGMASLFK